MKEKQKSLKIRLGEHTSKLVQRSKTRGKERKAQSYWSGSCPVSSNKPQNIPNISNISNIFLFFYDFHVGRL